MSCTISADNFPRTFLEIRKLKVTIVLFSQKGTVNIHSKLSVITSFPPQVQILNLNSLLLIGQKADNILKNLVVLARALL